MTVLSFRYFTSILTVSSVLLCSACSSGGDEGPIEITEINGFHYAFEESGDSDILDSSGNQFDATSYGLTRILGKVGNAVQFTNPGATIQPPLIETYSPFEQGFSFRAWVRSSQVIDQTKQTILGGFYSTPDNEIVNNFGIALFHDGFRVEFPDGTFADYIAADQLNLPVDQWFHIAVTYDGEWVTLYYNGSMVASDTYDADFEASFTNQFGYNLRLFNGTHYENQFHGDLDEVYLDARSLSGVEIMDYYLSTL